MVEIFNNLKKFDNLLGKYNIKSVDELDKKLTELDVWKRACKLACQNISVVQIITNNDMENNIDNLPKYFYQQAKKELENERK